MARRHFGGSSFRRQGPKRATQWLASADVTAVTALSGAASILDQSFTGAQFEALGGPVTIVRVRGELYIQSDQVAAAERPFGAMGFAVVSEQARAAGIASLPSPITDEASDLFFVMQYWEAASWVGNAASPATVMKRFVYDSKAMRKVPDGAALVVTMENAALAGIGAQYINKFRVLIKLN